ncbi:hypothetical protein PHYSODRAFT_325771 [Phytophthora sojae]|uniref:Uncharacterized protein n=1 Tax=Phytophthora sojae (strain P6497) TaxID=1094619 RepID=G4Z0C5_PHYSP|nr:hypothetical protein PHYSODRAFT_325771 [Phytophthora sojae]EGZ24682.1 hypothetical protein PHYSODRAFT_325771 [Phytophthora sojae]|eukprot:XP_009519970.1 hypothetical protein PHYSODRAFT_325771 [Phytophthora sojae]
MTAGVSGSGRNGYGSAVSTVNGMVSEAVGLRTQVAVGSSGSGVASDIDSRVSDTMEVTVALVDVVSGVSADMDTDTDAMVAGDSGSKHNGGRSAVCAVNSMVSEASAATVAVLDVSGRVGLRTQVAVGSSGSGVASDIDSRVSDTMEVTVALVDVVSGVSADMDTDTDTDAMVAGDSGSKHNGGRSAVCAVNSMVSEASAATVAVLDVSGRVGLRTQVAVGSSGSGVASDIDSRVSDTMEVTVALVDVVSGVSADMDTDTDTDAMVAGDSGSKHNGGRSAVCAVNSMVSEASAATVAVLDVSGRVGLRTQVAVGSSGSGVASDIDSRVSDTMEVTVALVDVVSGVSADMDTDTDTDAMVAGDSGSKHNGGRSAVCAVNSMVSEASAATVAVLDVSGRVGLRTQVAVGSSGSGVASDIDSRVSDTMEVTVALVDVVSGVSADMDTDTDTDAMVAGDSGSKHNGGRSAVCAVNSMVSEASAATVAVLDVSGRVGLRTQVAVGSSGSGVASDIDSRVSDTMEVTVALVDVVSGVSADMDTDTDAMVAGDSGSKHNGGRSAVCAVNSMVSEASAATVAVLDVSGRVGLRTQVAVGSSGSGVASDIDSRVSDTMEVTVALVDVVSGVSADMDTDTDAMVAGDSGSKHNGGRSAVCAVNSMVSEASAATVAVLDVSGRVGLRTQVAVGSSGSGVASDIDSRVSDTMEVTVALVDVVSGVSADMDTDTDAMVAGDSGSKHNGGRSAVCAVNSMVSEASAATVAVLDVSGRVGLRTQVAVGSSGSGVASDIDSRVSDTMEVTVALVDVVSGVSADMDTDTDAMVAGDSGSKHNGGRSAVCAVNSMVSEASAATVAVLDVSGRVGLRTQVAVGSSGSGVASDIDSRVSDTMEVTVALVDVVSGVSADMDTDTDAMVAGDSGSKHNGGRSAVCAVNSMVSEASAATVAVLDVSGRVGLRTQVAVGSSGSGVASDIDSRVSDTMEVTVALVDVVSGVSADMDTDTDAMVAGDSGSKHNGGRSAVCAVNSMVSEASAATVAVLDVSGRVGLRTQVAVGSSGSGVASDIDSRVSDTMEVTVALVDVVSGVSADMDTDTDAMVAGDSGSKHNGGRSAVCAVNSMVSEASAATVAVLDVSGRVGLRTQVAVGSSGSGVASDIDSRVSDTMEVTVALVDVVSGVSADMDTDTDAMVAGDSGSKHNGGRSAVCAVNSMVSEASAATVAVLDVSGRVGLRTQVAVGSSGSGVASDIDSRVSDTMEVTVALVDVVSGVSADMDTDTDAMVAGDSGSKHNGGRSAVCAVNSMVSEASAATVAVLDVSGRVGLRTQVAVGSSGSGVASDIDSRVSDTMEVTVALVDVVSGVSADMDTDTDAMVAGDSGSKHNGGRSAVCAVNSMVSEASAATVAVLDVSGRVGLRTQVAVGSSGSGVASDIDSRVSDTMEVTVALVDVVSGVSADMDTDTDAMVAGDSGSKHNGGRSAVCAVNSMVSEASAATVAVLDVSGRVGLRTQVAVGSSGSGVASDIDSRVSDTMEVTVALVDVVSGVSADMDTDTDAMVAGDSGSKHNGGRSAVCAVNSMVSEASAATVAVLDVSGRVGLRTQVAVGSSGSGVASDIDSRVSDTMEVTVALVDVVSGVSADMDTDTDAMVAGDSGSKHNGGRSAVCAVNSMVSEASAATVAVLDVSGRVGLRTQVAVGSSGSGVASDIDSRVSDTMEASAATVAVLDVSGRVGRDRGRLRWHGHERDVRTQVAVGSSGSGVASDIDSRVSDTMEVTVALVDVVSGVSADMDTDTDAMVAGDSGSKHNGGRSAVCAVNSMVSEASAATVAVLDVSGRVGLRTQVAVGSSGSGVASDIDSRVSDTMEVTVALVDVVSGVSADMDTDTDAMVAGDSGSKHNGGRSAVCAVNSMVSEASAATVAVLDVSGRVGLRTQVAVGSSGSGVASDIDSRVSDTMEVTVALVDVVSGVSADMDTDTDAMVAGDSGSKHNGGRSAVCAVNSMVSEASAATVAVLDVSGRVGLRTQVAVGSSGSGVASDIDSRVSDTMEVTVALVDVVSGVSADMDTDTDAMVAGDSGSKHNGGRSAVCAVNSMVSEASAATVAVLDVSGRVGLRTQVAVGSSGSGVASDIDSRVSDTMEVTVALVDVVSGVSADMDTDTDAMVAGDSGSKHNGGRSAVCAVNSMVSEASAATVAVLDVSGRVGLRTQVAVGSSGSGVASDIDSRVSDTMEVTVALVDVVSGVSADMDTDTDAMVAGDSGSKHNGGRSAVCAVNSMVSEASAATVAVLDVSGRVGLRTQVAVGSSGSGVASDIDSRVSDTMEVTVALVDVVSGVSADMDTDTDAMVAGDSGSKHNGGRSAVCAVNSMVSEASAATVAVLDVSGRVGLRTQVAVGSSGSGVASDIDSRVSDTMEVTVALVDVVSGVSADMDTDTDAMVAGDSGSKHNGGRSAVCAVNSMVSEASAATVAVLDVSGRVGLRTQVAVGSSGSGVASDIDSRVSDTMEVTVALVDVVSGVSADMDTDTDAMVAGDSGSKHNGGRSAVCAVNSMVSEASAATVAVLDVSGRVGLRTQVAVGSSGSGVASDIDSRVSDTMEVTVTLVDVVSGVSADMDTDTDAMVAGDSGSKHNGGRSAVCAVNSMVSEASAATVAVLDVSGRVGLRTQVAVGSSGSGVASDIDSRVSDTMEVTVALVDVVSGVSADMDTDTDAMVAGDSGSKHNGGCSAVCAVNSMVSEASAATVAVLDVSGRVGLRTQVAVGSSGSGVASDIDSRVSDTMEVTVALVDVVSGVSADMDTDTDAMVAGDSGSKHNGGRSAVCAVNSMVSEASAATVAVLDVSGRVGLRTQVAVGSSGSGVASDIDSRVSDTMEVTVALVDVVSGVSADMDTDTDAMVAGDSGSKHNGGRSAVCAVNSMVSEASAATVAVLDVSGRVGLRTQVAVGSSGSGVASDIDSRVSDTMEVTVALVDVVSGVSADMDTDTDAMVAGDSGSKHNGGRSAVCAVNSMVSEASAATVAVLDVSGRVGLRTQVAVGSSGSGVASDIDSRVSDTMEVTVALVDVVSGVSADMDTDTDAMVAGDSGSKHNGGRSAVCAVNSMVSEASAATVAVLDVIGGVSAGMVTNATVAVGSSGSGVASDIDSRVSDTMEVTVALVDVVSGVSADMDTDTDAMVAGDSGSKHNGGRSAVCAVNSMVSEASAATVAVLDVSGRVGLRTQVAVGSSGSGVASDIDSRVSDTMEVTVALVDVVSGVSADMDTDTDAMVAGDSGSKHNGGRSAVCAVNSMVSEASAATVAVLDVIGGVSAGMVTNATVAVGSSGSGVASDIDSRVSDTMEVTVALVDVVSGVSADMDTDTDAMVAGDSGSKHNGGRSAVCAVNSMVSEASAATVAVLDVSGRVGLRTQVAVGSSGSGVASDIDSRVSDTMEVTVALVDVVSGVSADMDTDTDAMVAGDSGSKHNGGRSAVCAVNSMVSEASAATVAVLDVSGRVGLRTQVAVGSSGSGVASDIDSRVSDTMEVTVALVDVVSGVSADMDTDTDAMVAGDSGSKHNGGRSAVCAVNSMVSEASAATVAVLDVSGRVGLRTQVAVGSSGSGVASDIDSRVSDTMEVTVALVDVVSGVSADMDTDTDAMVAGDSGSKHNGGRSAVCAVNSMVSEASAATVAVLDVSGRVGLRTQVAVGSSGSGVASDIDSRVSDTMEVTVALVDVVSGVSADMDTDTDAMVAGDSGSKHNGGRSAVCAVNSMVSEASAATVAVLDVSGRVGLRTQVAVGSSGSGVASDIDSRVSDTMEVTVALVDVVSGVSADMDTDTDAMVAGDSGSKHNGGRSAVCAVNSMVSEASAATVAVLDVSGRVGLRTQVAVGSSGSGVASHIDSRVSDTMEVTVALVDVVSGDSADMDTDTDAMVAGDSGSKHNGGRSAVCAVNSMVSEASAATVAVLDVSGRVGREAT